MGMDIFGYLNNLRYFYFVKSPAKKTMAYVRLQLNLPYPSL